MKISSDFLEKENLNIIYGDTDSLYINIPNINLNNNEKSIKALEISNSINNTIKEYLDTYLLPKMGVDPNFNTTFFKIESVIENIMLLGKKCYVYNQLSKKGIEDKDRVYIGLPVIRSDYSKFSQNFIKELIDIALDNNITNKTNMLQELGKIKYDDLIKSINEFNIEYISTPGKWKNGTYKSETFIIVGMKLYNTIFNLLKFTPGSTGYSIPIDINDTNLFTQKININKNDNKLFLNNTDINNINYIVIPYDYDKVDLINKLKEFSISINSKSLWDKSYSTVGKNIVKIIKDSI